jgi:hypothetical protein
MRFERKLHAIRTILVEVDYTHTQKKSVNVPGHGVTKHVIISYSLHAPEIYTQHFRARVVIRHIDGPDTGTGSHVKNAMRVAHYRRFVQLSIQQMKHNFVMKVHSILFSLCPEIVSRLPEAIFANLQCGVFQGSRLHPDF